MRKLKILVVTLVMTLLMASPSYAAIVINQLGTPSAPWSATTRPRLSAAAGCWPRWAADKSKETNMNETRTTERTEETNTDWRTTTS